MSVDSDGAPLQPQASIASEAAALQPQASIASEVAALQLEAVKASDDVDDGLDDFEDEGYGLDLTAVVTELLEKAVPPVPALPSRDRSRSPAAPSDVCSSVSTRRRRGTKATPMCCTCERLEKHKKQGFASSACQLSTR